MEQIETNKKDNWLTPNKRIVFSGNEILGSNNIMIDANIIAFEHALEKIQNKMCLPEYNGPEDFGNENGDHFDHQDTTKNEKYEPIKECNNNLGSEFSSKNLGVCEDDKKQTTLSVLWRKQHKSIDSKSVKFCKNSKVNVNRSKSIEIKEISNANLKQITIDKYSFQNNLFKSPPKSSCSIIISNSESTSVNNKKYTNEKILYFQQLINLEDMCPFSQQNSNINMVSRWREKLRIPDRSTKITHEGSELGTVTSQTLQSFANPTSEEQIPEFEGEFYEPSDSDPLDLDIDKAIQKYESVCEVSLADAEVQTTLPCVHACNCLGYHFCNEFKGLPNKKCSEGRNIAALDLMTLHHVSRKRHNFEKSEIFYPTQMSKYSMALTINDQKVPLSERMENSVCEAKNSAMNTNSPSSLEHSVPKIEDKSQRINDSAQIVPNKYLKTEVVAINKTFSKQTKGKAHAEWHYKMNESIEKDSKIAETYQPVISGGSDEINPDYNQILKGCNDNYLNKCFLCNSVSCNCIDKYPNEKKSNNFQMAFSPATREQYLNFSQVTENVEKDYSNMKTCLNGMSGESLHKKDITEIDEISDNDKQIGNGKSHPYKENQSNLNTLEETLYEHIDEGKISSFMEHDIPNVNDENNLAVSHNNNLTVRSDIQSDTQSRNNSYQWEPQSYVSNQMKKKPFEECCVPKVMSQKPRRIGLSRRDKPVSLHPKKRQNLSNFLLQ